jgi:beta-aspartyl-peptidase (threonine type)
VALDGAGQVAAATSTGGITGKRGGRVGDSPLAGAGGYADSEAGAVSTTGHGESISRVCLAHRVVRGLAAGPGQAAREGLAYMQARVGGSGGLVVVDRTGGWAAEFTTQRMPWAVVSGEGEWHGFLPGELLGGPGQGEGATTAIH